jgi:hypothetical protein
MIETSRGQARPATSLGTLRGRLLDIASHPRIPEGASLTGIAILVGLATGLGCIPFLIPDRRIFSRPADH